MDLLKNIIILLLCLTSCSPESEPITPIIEQPTGILKEVKETLTFASKQYKLMIPTVPEAKLCRNTEPDGHMRSVNPWDWTSGFYPGILWYLYEYTNDNTFESEAIIKTNIIESQKNVKSTHDLGFMLYNSFGNGYRINHQDQYKEILLTGAKSLVSRYNEQVGCIKSWDWAAQWKFPVIVDNMMNLEYLFWAFKITGDSSYYHKAVSHADITISNHYRSDNSCYHVLDYNPTTGQLVSKTNLQGYNDESIWARGQAWGLYGYTVMYRETNNKKYLEHANKIVSLIFDHVNMPEDNIPHWDFLAPGIATAPRDASAAAIIASALIELQGYMNDSLQKEYLKKAESILTSLMSEEYLVKLGENNHFLLKHATGHHPAGKEIDTEIIYADYYFVEALIRYSKLW